MQIQVEKKNGDSCCRSFDDNILKQEMYIDQRSLIHNETGLESLVMKLIQNLRVN